MRWTGDGSELWRVRVDLFVERREPIKRQMNAIHENLKAQLTQSDGDATTDRGASGLDQGTGAAGRDVIGILFWVRANDVGQAASTAVDVARRVGAGEGVGPGLYDVVVIPRDAVTFSKDGREYPQMPD
jgi:hypothetical protein